MISKKLAILVAVGVGLIALAFAPARVEKVVSLSSTCGYETIFRLSCEARYETRLTWGWIRDADTYDSSQNIPSSSKSILGGVYKLDIVLDVLGAAAFGGLTYILLRRRWGKHGAS